MSLMKVKEGAVLVCNWRLPGDVLVCKCGNCELELKACNSDKCGHDVACEVEATCCGEPMVLK